MLDGERIHARLAERGSSGEVVVLSTVGSTNDEAREAAERGAAHFTAFVADAQTSGRGRGDHRWHSPAGANIYLSLLLRPETLSSDLGVLPLVVGLTVAEVVDVWLDPPRAMIKWPNDVFVDGKKLGGVLVESTIQGRRPPVVVVGVGVNVAAQRFPADIADRATSLGCAAGRDIDRDRVAADLIAALRSALGRFMVEGLTPLLPELRRRDFLRDKVVSGVDFRGVAQGIADDGRLSVDGRLVAAGEVTLVPRDQGGAARRCNVPP